MGLNLTLYSPGSPFPPEERWEQLRKVIAYKFTSCKIGALTNFSWEARKQLAIIADEHAVLLVLMGELDGSIKTKEDADNYLKSLGA